MNKSLAQLGREIGTKQGIYMQINIFVHRYLQTDDFWSLDFSDKNHLDIIKEKKKPKTFFHLIEGIAKYFWHLKLSCC